MEGNTNPKKIKETIAKKSYKIIKSLLDSRYQKVSKFGQGMPHEIATYA